MQSRYNGSDNEWHDKGERTNILKIQNKYHWLDHESHGKKRRYIQTKDVE